MKTSQIVTLSHQLIDQLVTKDDIIIDATLGNGYDSLYLSTKVKQVYAFDIQELAISNSKKTLENTSNVKIVLDSHLNYKNYLNHYDGVIFNLGYLPTGNKQITTTSRVTLETLNQMIFDNIARFIIIVVYPGHPEGMIESVDLNNYLPEISNYQFQKYYLSDNPKKAYLILLTKKSS